MAAFQISGQPFELDAEQVAEGLDGVLPDPVQEHYVVIGGRRYPPKQVLSCITGLDRADFTTHQARRILKRLGFVAARAGRRSIEPEERAPGGAQAAALAPFVGQWVALATPTEILVAAETPQEVLAWLARHEQRAAYGMFRVPSSTQEAEGAAPL
jgi:hypothetical protein